MASLETWLQKIDQAYTQNEYHFAEIFQHLHQYPELAREEEKTSSYLKKLIQEHTGLSILTKVHHGFLAGYGTSKNASLCLRGDMDALPIQEKTKLTYISNNPGIMHACGHDFHATAVYAVALLWDKLVGPFPLAPTFMFQHAEEPIPGGALDFLEAKVLDNITEIYGLHVEPNFKTGTIGLTEGWINAQSIRIDVSITGTGGHSARPLDTINPLKASIGIIESIYTDLSRKNDPGNPHVFSVTQINTDNKAYNAIPKTVSWVATLRVSDESLGDKLLDLIENKIRKMSESEKLTFKFDFIKGAPPVVNDAKSIESAAKIKKILVKHNWKFDNFRSLGGDDFGWFSQLKPGFLIRVGITPEDQDPIPLHSDQFKVDFSALKNAVIFYLLYFIQRADLVE